VAGGIKSMGNSNDSVGNRTCDLPACSAVPQPTAPPRRLRPVQNMETDLNVCRIQGTHFSVDRVTVDIA